MQQLKLWVEKFKHEEISVTCLLRIPSIQKMTIHVAVLSDSYLKTDVRQSLEINIKSDTGADRDLG